MGRVIADATEAAAELGRAVDEAKSVVFFGGAGVSTASGIPDFRSEDGLYHYGCTFTGMPAVFDYIFEEMEEEYRKIEAEANAEVQTHGTIAE